MVCLLAGSLPALLVFLVPSSHTTTLRWDPVPVPTNTLPVPVGLEDWSFERVRPGSQLSEAKS